MAFKHALAGTLGAWFIRFLRFTWRIDEQPPDYVLGNRVPGKPGRVYVMWHSRILLGAAVQAGRGFHVMISQHGDGELIARAIGKLGYETIRGSTSRGGRKALVGAVRSLQSGNDVAVTPDGPRGPRLTVQPGCAVAAWRAGTVVVPVGFEAGWCKRLASWDRFVVPWPFSRVIVRYGVPVEVGEDVEAGQAAVLAGMLDATEQAAAVLGRPGETVEVDPRPDAPRRSADA